MNNQWLSIIRLKEKYVDKHFRATGAGVINKFILERVEVDHTPLDVIVLNEKTGLADGRPTLTLLLDRYSRMPLGFEIGFEVPSELSVSLGGLVSKSCILKQIAETERSWYKCRYFYSKRA